MKKTFLAMLLAGGTMTMFAQTTPTTPTKPTTPTTPTSTPANPTSTPTEPATTNPMSTQPATGVNGNNGTYNNTQMNSNNPQMNTMNGVDGTMPNSTYNMRNGTRMNSTSWAPEKDPSWGWNNYGVWGSDANWNANGNAMNNANMNGTATMNGTANMNGTTNMNSSGIMDSQNMNNNTNAGTTNWNNQNTATADGAMNSNSAYSAYGTAVPYLPSNVQTRFGQDYPMTTGRSYSWNQYGDWYHTHMMDNGRSTQYFYDTKGNGYSLALPVLLTYVPENIVTSALNKFGADLYSISLVKTNDGKDNYMVKLLDRGQVSMHYMDESGVSVNDVWRTDDYGTMQSTQSNAAMSDDSMNNNMNQNSNWDANKDKKAWDADKDKKKEHHDKKSDNNMR